jgi:hypothetical protein
MSAANGRNLDALVGRTVGCRPGRDRGVWLWATVTHAQDTPWGCRLFVVHPIWRNNGQWVSGRDVRTRSKRDAAIIDEANAEAQRSPASGDKLPPLVGHPISQGNSPEGGRA